MLHKGGFVQVCHAHDEAHSHVALADRMAQALPGFVAQREISVPSASAVVYEHMRTRRPVVDDHGVPLVLFRPRHEALQGRDGARRRWLTRHEPLEQGGRQVCVQLLSQLGIDGRLRILAEEGSQAWIRPPCVVEFVVVVGGDGYMWPHARSARVEVYTDQAEHFVGDFGRHIA